MKRIFSILFTVIMVAFIGNQAEAQSLMQTAKKAEQRAKELKRQEQIRFDSIVDTKDLAKYNKFIKDYPFGKNTPEIKKRAEELTLWFKATSSNTESSYQTYLNRTQYHWFDEKAKQSIASARRNKEKQDWEKVRSLGTINGYKQYLSDNPFSEYKKEAEISINKLEAKQAWRTLKFSDNISELEKFVSSYPHASEKKEAESRLHELRGRNYYDEGKLSLAYYEFSQTNRYKISEINRKAFDTAMEYHEFSLLSHNSPEHKLHDFMIKHPTSQFNDQVSNMIALSKAYNFSKQASKSDYDLALGYAKDTKTIMAVKSLISHNKNIQKENKRKLKSQERKENGGIVNLGLELMDIGIAETYNNTNAWFYNLGLIFRIGNFKDRFQLAIGIKPGIFSSSKIIDYRDQYYDGFDNEFKDEVLKKKYIYSFHLPISGQLKLNLFKITEKARCFVFGRYQYNILKNSDIEGETAWSAGFGFAWKHFDMSFHYLQDVKNGYLNNEFWGMSLIYYWTL